MSSADREQALAEVASPATPAARLAEIVYAHPDLAPVVRMHPECYPELRDWIDQYATAAVAAATEPALDAAPVAAVQETYPSGPTSAAVETAPVMPTGAVTGPTRNRRGLVVAIAAASVAVLALGTVTTVGIRYAMTDGFAKPGAVAVALPPTTVSFVEIDLAPSASQAQSLAALAEKVPSLLDSLASDGGPDLTGDVDVADLQEAAWDAIFSGMSDVDFATEIAPWFDGVVAIASVGDPDTGDYSTAYAFEAKDGQEAADAVSALVDDHWLDANSWVQIGDWVVVSDGELTLGAYDEGRLSDSDVFQEAMSKLGGAGIALAWTYPAGMARVDAADWGLGENELDEQYLNEASSTALSVSATSDGVEARAVITHAGLASSGADVAGLVADLPASSFAAVGGSNPGAFLAAVLDPETAIAYSSTGLQPGYYVGDSYYAEDLRYQRENLEDGLAEELGITSLERLDAALDGPFAGALDYSMECDDLGWISGCLDSGMDLGATVLTQSTDTGARRLLDDAASTVGAYDGTIVDDDGKLVWRSGWAQDESPLGDSDAFRRAMPSTSGAEAMAYVDISELVDRLVEYPEDARWYRDFEAAGAVARIDSSGALVVDARAVVFTE